MKPSTRLAQNSLWMLASRAGSQGLAVVFTILLARQMGGQAFGQIAFMLAAVALGNTLTTFGSDMLLIRRIAAAGGELAGLGEALAIQLILSALFIAGVMVYAPYFPNQAPEAVLGLQIYSLSLVPLAFFSVFTAVLRGRQRMGTYMALNLALALLQVAAAGLVTGLGGGVAALAAALVLVQLAAAVLAGVLCAVRIPGFLRAWHFSARQAVRLGRACAPIALLALTGMLYQKLSITMLSAMGGALVTGWFAAAARTVEASKMVHQSVFTALYPAMAQAGPGDASFRRPWQGPFRRAWWWLLAGAGCAALGLFLLAGPLVGLLYGEPFLPAVPAMRILAWSLLPFTVNNFLTLTNLAAGREGAILRVQLVGLAALAGLSAWWIPRFGLVGASLAGLLAESAMAAAYLVPLLFFSKKSSTEIFVRADPAQKTLNLNFWERTKKILERRST
jgi:O-antigen/teichoic acid export membrane protein